MLVAVTADLHGRWQAAAKFAALHDCDAIFVAGDIGEASYGADWPVPVYWVWGDDDSRLIWRTIPQSVETGRCHLIRDWTTIAIDGLVVLGIGAERDNAALPGPAMVLPPYGPIPHADIVLSHAAGWRQCVRNGSKSYDVFDAQVGRAIHESGARIALSGHHHQWLMGAANDGRTRCYGLGNSPDSWAVLDTATLTVTRPGLQGEGA